MVDASLFEFRDRGGGELDGCEQERSRRLRVHSSKNMPLRLVVHRRLLSFDRFVNHLGHFLLRVQPNTQQLARLFHDTQRAQEVDELLPLHRDDLRRLCCRDPPRMLRDLGCL